MDYIYGITYMTPFKLLKQMCIFAAPESAPICMWKVWKKQDVFNNMKRQYKTLT